MLPDCCRTSQTQATCSWVKPNVGNNAGEIEAGIVGDKCPPAMEPIAAAAAAAATAAEFKVGVVVEDVDDADDEEDDDDDDDEIAEEIGLNPLVWWLWRLWLWWRLVWWLWWWEPVKSKPAIEENPVKYGTDDGVGGSSKGGDVLTTSAVVIGSTINTI